MTSIRQVTAMKGLRQQRVPIARIARQFGVAVATAHYHVRKIKPPEGEWQRHRPRSLDHEAVYRTWLDEGLDAAALAERFGSTPRYIGVILKQEADRTGGPKPCEVAHRRYDYQEIFYQLRTGVKRKDICRELGITPQALSKIINNPRNQRYRDMADQRLRREVREAFSDGDTVRNIVVWSGLKHDTVKRWLRDLIEESGS